MQSILEFIRSIGPQELSVLLAFIATLTAISSAIAAIFSTRSARHSARISSQQYQLQILATQIALYERMLSIYKIVMNFIEIVSIRDDIESEDGRESYIEAFMRLKTAASESRFIFDDVIQEYIREIISKDVKLRQVSRRLTSYSGGDEGRQELESKREELSSWFTEQQLRVIEKFNPYLTINLPIQLERPTLFHQYRVSLESTKKKSIFKSLISFFRGTHSSH